MSAAPFPVLGDGAYVDYVGPLRHRGSNPTVHLASVRYPVQAAPVISVVKFLPPNGMAACNEAIAWLFMRAAGLHTPKYAALLSLRSDKAKRALGERRQLPDGLESNGFVLAWAAHKLPFGSLQVLFAGIAADDRWLQLLHTAQGAAIAAFDEAFLNLDRNTGNTLYASATRAIPVDNEMLFGMQPWHLAPLKDLEVDSDSLGTLKRGVRERRVTLRQFEDAKNRMVECAAKHSAALQACQLHISELLVSVHGPAGDEMARRVLSFVARRTLRHWMADRLGVL